MEAGSGIRVAESLKGAQAGLYHDASSSVHVHPLRDLTQLVVRRLVRETWETKWAEAGELRLTPSEALGTTCVARSKRALQDAGRGCPAEHPLHYQRAIR